MLRATKQWDVRCPQALSNLFPVRSGYYYKVDRTQAQATCNALSAAYGIKPPRVRSTSPTGGNRGVCYMYPNGHSEIEVHARGHIKSTFHEWYHHLDNATRGKYNSDDRQGGPASLAWQFADRLFEVFRNQRSTSSRTTNMKTVKKSAKKTTVKTVAAKTAAPKRVKKEAVTVTAASKIAFKAPRPKAKGNGKKTRLLNMLPKKGTITLKQLVVKAKEALGLPEAKVSKWVVSMSRQGSCAIQ